MDESDRPSCACLYLLMFSAMISVGMLVLCVAGDRMISALGWRIYGTWLVYPVAIVIGFLFLFPFMRLATRHK